MKLARDQQCFTRNACNESWKSYRLVC